MGWPVCFKSYDHPRMEGHFGSIWDGIAPSFAEPAAGKRRSGLYESKGLIALGKAWTGQSDKMAQVRDGLQWVAEEHATPDTHVMGETWMLRDGEVVTGFGQPHAWEQVLFHLASLEAYPPGSLGGAPPATCGVALGALQGR
jgi:hypothetical protein